MQTQTRRYQCASAIYTAPLNNVNFALRTVPINTHSCKLRTWFSAISLRFNGDFPREPGLAGVYWSKGRWRWWVVTTGAISRAKLQSNHHQQTNTQSFYRPDVLPVAQPTVSKHWREISHSMDLLTPSSPGVF